MSVSGSRDRAIGESLAAGRDRAFVGRRAEVALFRAALAGNPAARTVHYLHGPGGIGNPTPDLCA